jgi:hypothetical protein
LIAPTQPSREADDYARFFASLIHAEKHVSLYSSA